jgi:wyosine [tRNA(Phe)-imidazoG37] synthetase (radical SAM superfamily)
MKMTARRGQERRDMMDAENTHLVFGPVPSRRLGRSLGINNIPPKFCSYSCVYCQVGRTFHLDVQRREFYKPESIVRNVEKKIREAAQRAEPVDYLSFVPDGEPTLDSHLGREIRLLKTLGLQVAVITNSSLIWREDVRNDLSEADWVSVKIDAASRDVWRKINRPQGSLSQEKILQGIRVFRKIFKGRLVTETMLVQGINDQEGEMERTADGIAGMGPETSYISVPTRPSSEKDVRPPAENAVNRAYHIFGGKGIPTELLTGYEGNAFAFTGNAGEDLLSITSVHPMREDAVRELLAKADAGWEVVENLLKENKLVESHYENRVFYLRKLGR